MEVTKRGVPKAQRLWKGRCNGCGSEAIATEAELQVQHDQREGYSFAWHKCPVCGDDGPSRGLLFYPAAEDAR